MRGEPVSPPGCDVTPQLACSDGRQSDGTRDSALAKALTSCVKVRRGVGGDELPGPESEAAQAQR